MKHADVSARALKGPGKKMLFFQRERAERVERVGDENCNTKIFSLR